MEPSVSPRLLVTVQSVFSETILDLTDSMNWDEGAKSFAAGDLLAKFPNSSY